MEIFELEAVAPMCLLINLLSRNFKTSIAKKYSCLFVIYTYLPEQNILPCVSLYNIYLFYYPSNHCRKIPKNLYEVLYLLTYSTEYNTKRSITYRQFKKVFICC